MKKKLISLLLAGTMVFSLAACGSQAPAAPAADATTGDTAEAQADTEPEADAEEASTDDSSESATAGELTDGKFAETRHITVEVYDRGNDGGSDPTNNKYTKYIQDGMLADHNVEVEFVAVPRWTEVDEINNLLAAGEAPDICVTYSYATIQTYANMGGVQDLAQIVEDTKADCPNLWDWLGETNIYWDKSPVDGTLWAIEGKRATANRVNTFVRQDWLDALDLKAPTTKQEFEDMLIAFRDNADKLLGADAKKMVPYSVSFDVGWRAATLIESFIDPAISDYDYYVNGFDDRKFTEPGTKEAVKLLNKWYNDGLMWNDFALYGEGDTTEDDMMKAGYVGAFTHNWDYPFRNGEDSINANLQRIVGEDAKFVAIDPFEDSKGTHTKFVDSTAGDRKIFFPTTNDEPLASMLYLDWISAPEHIEYLQLGDEGVTHNKLDDGSYEIIAATGDDIQNSGFNIDMTITCNGLHLTDPKLTDLTTAHSYANIDPQLVQDADKIAKTDTRPAKCVNVGEITSESGVGEALNAKRTEVYDLAVTAAPADFDSVWDSGMEEYMAAGGKDVSDERAAKWAEVYGDTKSVPEL
ncbi:MAG: extracellular solute-binding protein [Lachnospiraceae bacterium]|nr:extracellular solute-binding protein [Lachnospiraceae bacterium]